jgi:hypothetical protein
VISCPVLDTLLALLPLLSNSRGTIRAIKASRIHDNTRHLAMKISWLNDKYTKTTLQLANLNTKPLCEKNLQVIIVFRVGVRYYPQENTKHYQSLYLDCCQISKYYLLRGRSIPVSSVSS